MRQVLPLGDRSGDEEGKDFALAVGWLHPTVRRLDTFTNPAREKLWRCLLLSFFHDRPAFSMFRDSARELQQLRSLVLTALLTALQIVTMSFSLDVLPTLRISFAFVFQAATGMLFGPVVAAMQCVAADLLKSFMLPTAPFFPGYTLTALLTGVVYGCFFYRARVTWPRALCAKGLVNVALHIGLNTLWMSLTLNQGIWAILPERVLKNLGLLVIEVPLLVATYTILQRIPRRPRS